MSNILKGLSKSKTYRKCVVPCCSVKYGIGGGFFNFPSNPAQKEKWLSACGLTSVKPSAVVCQAHFDESAFTSTVSESTIRRRLIKFAVPSLNLPMKPEELGHFEYFDPMATAMDVNIAPSSAAAAAPPPAPEHVDIIDDIVMDVPADETMGAEHNYAKPVDMICMLQDEIKALKRQNSTLKRQNSTLKRKSSQGARKFRELVNPKLKTSAKFQDKLIRARLNQFSEAQLDIMLNKKVIKLTNHYTIRIQSQNQINYLSTFQY